MTGLQNSINDRIITRITITKDTPSKSPINLDTMSKATAAMLNGTSKRSAQEPKDYKMSTASDASTASNRTDDTENGMTLGISIVQGSDNNVYVKDLVKNGPGDRYGILIGDQVCTPRSHSISNTVTKYIYVYNTARAIIIQVE